ncbi:MAG: acyltransferase [Lachnospiraceae bacterium]|nr:acyltransferase [Lachnospiraceae bacterium]
MNWYRVRHTIGMYLTLSAQERAKYIKRHHLFHHMGDKCMVMFRKIPIYPELISVGDNVWIASGVLLVTHDVIHRMLNRCVEGGGFQEHLGCIDIKDNVFIGSNSTILPNVSIGPNAIIAAGTVVNKSIGGGVYAGVPARYVCSLDDFIEKRKQIPKIQKEKEKGRISKKTVEAYWQRFKEMENRRGETS